MAQIAPTVPPAQANRLEKPSADVPFEVDRQPNAGAKDEPQRADLAAAEKDASDTTTGSEPAKEAKPDGDTAAGSSEPHQANSESQPTVPATVVICGVTYDASQLADLKVPDHCGKPAQQPNPTTGSK